MIRKSFVLILFAISVSGFSQFSISGTITDSEGAPLVGANVFILELLQGTVTGQDGGYKLNKFPEGNHTLIVTFMGFEEQKKSIDLKADLKIDFVLAEMNYLADEIMVYGTRARENYPIAFTNVSREELQRANTGDDITYMLSATPSLVATSEAGIGLGYTAMRIRGSDPTRINVTMNGIPLNDAESQGVFWVNMPDFGSSVDNVQIQRGVGTSTQGAGAFGATVNFQTKELSSEPYAAYQLVGGSFNTFRNTLKLGSGLIGNHFSVDARLSKLNTDGYIDHSFSDHGSIYLSGAYHAKNSLIRFTYLDGTQRTGISWWGVPDYVIDTNRTYNPAGVYYNADGKEQYYEDQTDNYRQRHYQLHFSQNLGDNFDLNLAGHYTKGEGFFEQYKSDASFMDYGLDSMMVINSDTITESDLVRRKWLDNVFYGLTGAINYRNSRLEATLGGGWNRYRGEHFGNIPWMENNSGVPKDYEWYTNEGVKTDWNIYLRASYLITSKLSLFGDLQVRGINYSMDGIDDDLLPLIQNHSFNFFNPKMGANYQISQSSRAYASLSVANREPTRSIFKEAKGDPDAMPLPEKLFDYEFGYSYSLPRFSIAANLYYMNYKDQLVPTGEKSTVGYDIMTNVDESYRAGIELMAAIRPVDFIEWNLNATLSKNKIKNFVEYSTHYSNWNEGWDWYETEEYLGTPLGETDIAFSPNFIGSSILNFKFAKSAQLAIISKYVGKQYFDNTSSESRKIDPYFVNDLNFSCKVPLEGIKDLRLNLQINNILNTQYISNAYGGNWYEESQEMTWAYFYPQAGIHFFAGFTVQF